MGGPSTGRKRVSIRSGSSRTGSPAPSCVEARLGRGELGFAGAPQRLDLLERRDATREAPPPARNRRFERRALLFDFGGVVYASCRAHRLARRPNGSASLVQRGLVGGQLEA